VLALAGVLAACGAPPAPDVRSERRGPEPASASDPAPRAEARRSEGRGVASTDAALLVEQTR
jgi:hypothetical protein